MFLTFTGTDMIARLWSVDNATCVQEYKAHTRRMMLTRNNSFIVLGITSFRQITTGHTLVSTSADGRCIVWHTANGVPIVILQPDNGISINCVCVTQTVKQFARCENNDGKHLQQLNKECTLRKLECNN